MDTVTPGKPAHPSIQADAPTSATSPLNLAIQGLEGVAAGTVLKISVEVEVDQQGGQAELVVLSGEKTLTASTGRDGAPNFSAYHAGVSEDLVAQVAAHAALDAWRKLDAAVGRPV